MTWPEFVVQMHRLDETYPNETPSDHPLVHTQTMAIVRNPVSRPRRLPSPVPSSVPSLRLLASLRRLDLYSIHLDIIVSLLKSLSNLEELRCYKILTRPGVPGGEMMLSAFGRLRRLRILNVEFLSRCEHRGHPFSMSSRQSSLPVTLEQLTITNLVDFEETLLRGIGRGTEELRRCWHLMEESLVAKYSPFSRLTSLRHLSLGRCNGFTARVWRECILPCSASLEYVSFTGWHGGPCTPKRDQQQLQQQGEEEDVEQVMADVLANMRHLRTLELFDFLCGHGIVQGIERLDHLEARLLGASVHKRIEAVDSIQDLHYKYVSHCKIEFYQRV